MLLCEEIPSPIQFNSRLKIKPVLMHVHFHMHNMFWGINGMSYMVFKENCFTNMARAVYTDK